MNRLEGADKVAVQCSEKYFRHALNVVRRRISKHVRDFRDRSEEVGRVLYVVVTHSHNTNESRDQGQELTHTHFHQNRYLRKALCSLHSDFEKMQKCVLLDLASGERKEL